MAGKAGISQGAPRDRLSAPPAIFAELRRVLQADDHLARQVLEAPGPDQASELLARIGAMNGIPTSAAEIRAHVLRLTRDMQPRALPDSALDSVAAGGGAPTPWRDTLRDLLLPGSVG
jgi:hypothetical protein